MNHGPLRDRELIQVYERLIDVMRNLQKDDLAGGLAAQNESSAARGSTELEAELND
jgi:hypothetical protein